MTRADWGGVGRICVPGLCALEPVSDPVTCVEETPASRGYAQAVRLERRRPWLLEMGTRRDPAGLKATPNALRQDCKQLS